MFLCGAVSLRRITTFNRVTVAIFDWSFLSQQQVDQIDVIGRVMLYLNSAINPTLYALGSSFYRKAIIEAITCGRCRSTGKPGSTGSTGKQKTVSTVSSPVTNTDVDGSTVATRI